MHGGADGQVQRAAARRVAEAEVVAVYERYTGPNGDGGAVNVLAELAHLVSAVTSFRDFTEARLRAISVDEWASHGPRVAAEVKMFETACDQARRLLRDVSRLGMEDLERRAAGQWALLERARAERIADCFETALSMVEPTGRQRELAPRAMAWVLLHLAGEAAGD